VVVDSVVAQCGLAELGRMRLAETLRMIKLCRCRFGERGVTWKRKVGRSSEKEVSQYNCRNQSRDSSVLEMAFMPYSFHEFL